MTSSAATSGNAGAKWWATSNGRAASPSARWACRARATQAWIPLTLFVVFAVLAATAAAVLPARRAKLDVLTAIHHQW